MIKSNNFEGRQKRGKTCDDNQLREDKEDICKEAEARQIGEKVVGQLEKGEKWEGENEERGKVHPHLPIHLRVILLEG